MSDSLWQAYLTTRVRVRIDARRARTLTQVENRGGDDPWPFDELHAWIITACNPRSKQLPDEENHRRTEQLEQQIHRLGCRPYEALGFDPDDPTWREPGWAVPGLSEADVRHLAFAWEQNAVFLWEPECWTVAGVLLDRSTTHGWCYIDAPSTSA